MTAVIALMCLRAHEPESNRLSIQPGIIAVMLIDIASGLVHAILSSVTGILRTAMSSHFHLPDSHMPRAHRPVRTTPFTAMIVTIRFSDNAYGSDSCQ